jgi:iron complex outermembrane receptor protein
MTTKKRIICSIIFSTLWHLAWCQSNPDSMSDFSLHVGTANAQPATGATVEMLRGTQLVKVAIVDAQGVARFEGIKRGSYIFSITFIGYKRQTTGDYHFPSGTKEDQIVLSLADTAMKAAAVIAQKPFVEQKPGKVVLNIGSSVTNVGTTVLEVLEKSPGVTVDRNGGIALQGKTGVLVLIDGKPTYLGAADLNNLLSSMSSSQVQQIELMTNPSAKYDASGNAGIINIITKRTSLQGFNGSFTTSYGQGVYPKNNNNLVLNYRAGKVNTFLTYDLNFVKYLVNLYALRKYYSDSAVPTAILQQPSYFSGISVNNTVKTGLDYVLNPKATVGFVLGYTSIRRTGSNTGQAIWLDPTGTVDSTIATTNQSSTQFQNESINVNGKYSLSPAQELAVDADWLHYNLQDNQNYDNVLLTPGGYNQQYRGNIPTTIDIAAAKLDYTLKIGRGYTLQSGGKLSYSNTNNIALYQDLENGQWIEDFTMSDHFLYKENIRALYSDLEGKSGHFTVQAGLRYENTDYTANQLANSVENDSVFSRNYGGLFPSALISDEADSSNTFTLSAGRRIDRPAYQYLNPFYFVINKYTYETGNPFLLPQYSWNLQLSHSYKNVLTTSVSYSVIANYFSQLFLTDTTKDILLYSQGNVGHTYNFGLSATLTLAPCNWWSLTAEADFNYKRLAGFDGNNYTTSINQLTVSTTQQFSLPHQYTAEISGFYSTRAREDIQELLYPTGQLSAGASKPILKKKGTIKFSAKDILYTNIMEGLTQFPDATEYFKMHRDTRVVTISFSYRFGKAHKAGNHVESSAEDEMERVGTGR